MSNFLKCFYQQKPYSKLNLCLIANTCILKIHIDLCYSNFLQILSNEIFMEAWTCWLYFEIGLMYWSHPFSLRICLNLFLVGTRVWEAVCPKPWVKVLFAPIELDLGALDVGDLVTFFHSVSGSLKNGIELVNGDVFSTFSMHFHLLEISLSRMKGVA